MAGMIHVVDDDPDVLKALARLLAADGFDVAVSGSTREFLERYDPAATGCIILGTMLDELERRHLSTGCATLCVGGGMGIATIIERV